MNILERIEGAVETLIEGVFRNRFKGRIQPMEIGRSLIRAMESQKQISISKTYVPNDFKVYLHPDEISQLSSLRFTLAQELKGVLQEKAEKEKLSFIGEVNITFAERETVDHGTIEIEASFCEAAELDDRNTDQETAFVADTKMFKVPETLKGAQLNVEEGTGSPTTIELTSDVKVGRSNLCELTVNDNNVSRVHCRLVKSDGHWKLLDENSTNGTYVNGVRARDKTLKDGDQIQLGTTILRFREPSQ